MNRREEFVLLARQEGANRRQLCCRFGISRQTGYKWLERYEEGGRAALVDRSRQPHGKPSQTQAHLREALLALRAQHPAWGARKLCHRLKAMGHQTVASSTAHSILSRAGAIDHARSGYRKPFERFEHARPNDLWQADFKGDFPTLQGRCAPLTVLDDHSRYNLVLHACRDTRQETVKGLLSDTFRRYGVPACINFDNGAPWGSPSQPGQVTQLAVWLIRLGAYVSYSRPAHPQTNGKDERFHRSLDAEVVRNRTFASYDHLQAELDAWRHVYNHERPHQALNYKTPSSRYQISQRSFPETLPNVEYDENEIVVSVGSNGFLRFRGRRFKVSSALQGHRVALREHLDAPHRFDVYFAHQRCQTIDLDQAKSAG